MPSRDAPDVYAARAVRAFRAMERSFRTREGLYRRDGFLHLPGAAAHLWPFSRALAGMLDLAGMGAALVDGVDIDAAIVVSWSRPANRAAMSSAATTRTPLRKSARRASS